ncbi:MAG TPA: shikimate dehydrogenase [Sphingomicrobium sp.]|jgi:shikimate dehydrogenase
MRYAEVIGDPIAQSKSPQLHGYWLRQLGIAADYRALRVSGHGLASYLETRRKDADWLGCNATIPHKESIALLVDALAPEAAAVGAVNCVARDGDRLVGYNSDVDGIHAAIGHVPVEGRDVAVIGAGGAARAMLAYLNDRAPGSVTVLARDSAKAERLRSTARGLDLHHVPILAAEHVLASAALIVNASPLGMTGSPTMPAELLLAIEANAIGSTLFDMVYQPLETDFLRAGSAGGSETIDGLTMLIGQARRAFSLFFGREAPQDDDAVRALLTATPVPA